MTTLDENAKPAHQLPSPGAKKSSTADGTPDVLDAQRRLPEFQLVGKVCLISGAARGLGLTQAEALLEAGAIGELSP